MKIKKFAVAMSMVILSTPVLAGTTECTELDKEHWISTEQMQKILDGRGYKIINFELVGNCYKVHLETKEGKKIEGIYNPVGGHPMKRQVE
jgi:hypothetical protein